MKKINWFYLEQHHKDKANSIEDSFNASKHDGIIYPQDGYEKNKNFIYGKGYVKAKFFKVPKCTDCFDINIITEYVKQYGINCFFYSLCGTTLQSQDCCIKGLKREVQSILSNSVGLEYGAKFLELIHEINNDIKNIYISQGFEFNKGYSYINDVFISHNDLFRVKPQYSIMYYFLTKPTVDVVSDDDKLWEHFVHIHKAFNYDLDNSLPVSVKDRLIFLFNKDIAKKYENLLNNFNI